MKEYGLWPRSLKKTIKFLLRHGLIQPISTDHSFTHEVWSMTPKGWKTFIREYDQKLLQQIRAVAIAPPAPRNPCVEIPIWINGNVPLRSDAGLSDEDWAAWCAREGLVSPD